MSSKKDPASELMAAKQPYEIAALEWFLRLQEEPENQATHAAFHAWLEADLRHEEAFGKLQDLWCLAAESPATRRSHRQYTRRQVMKKAAVAGGAALATTSTALMVLDRLSTAPYRTGTGERRTVRLEDGSSVELATQSRIAPLFSGTERRIRLQHGEAYFSVAKDEQQRPFVVESPQGTATALGTEFSVAIREDVSLLSVTVHSVRACAREQRIEVQQGHCLRYGLKGLEAVQALQPSALAWRSGRLEFVSATLQDFVEVTNRWHTGKTFLADKSLATLPVTMMIDLTRITEAVQSLPTLLPVKTTEITPLLTFVSRA